MKLVIENSSEVEMVTESVGGQKQMYIEGIFAVAEAKNGNGRFYPKAVMEQAVETYQRDYISKRVSLGELNHPDRPFPDPRAGAILIESMTWQGNNVIGKAKVLNTPDGNIIKGLLEGGYNMGVSTRGLGEIKEANGQKLVESFMLTAVDAVSNPSGPGCYVNPVMESINWVEKGGVWVPVEEAVKDLVKKDKIDETVLLNKFKHLFGK